MRAVRNGKLEHRSTEPSIPKRQMEMEVPKDAADKAWRYLITYYFKDYNRVLLATSRRSTKVGFFCAAPQRAFPKRES